MNYKIVTFPPFEREAKRLAKHYKSLKQDLIHLTGELQANPTLGTDLGDGFRKIRLAIKSKASGKRGGARVITLTLLLSANETEIGLLYIYDKSDRESISSQELRALKRKCGL